MYAIFFSGEGVSIKVPVEKGKNITGKYHKDIVLEKPKHIIRNDALSLVAKTMGPAQSIAQVLVQTVYQCHSYWARHWPRPKLYAELGGNDVFLKLTACRKYIISSQNMV